MLKGAFSKVNRALDVGQRHIFAARIPIIIINLAPNDFAKVRLSRAARFLTAHCYTAYSFHSLVFSIFSSSGSLEISFL